jgi:hypothetical protein
LLDETDVRSHVFDLFFGRKVGAARGRAIVGRAQ